MRSLLMKLAVATMITGCGIVFYGVPEGYIVLKTGMLLLVSGLAINMIRIPRNSMGTPPEYGMRGFPRLPRRRRIAVQRNDD